MITTKQRAYLRALANKIEPTTQIGKFGVTAGVIKTVYDALEAHELIKLTVLETCEQSAKEVMVVLCDKLGCDPVQVIGRKLIVYRQSNDAEKRTIVLPK